MPEENLVHYGRPDGTPRCWDLPVVEMKVIDGEVSVANSWQAVTCPKCIAIRRTA